MEARTGFGEIISRMEARAGFGETISCMQASPHKSLDTEDVDDDADDNEDEA